jgi:hypothetical protein
MGEEQEPPTFRRVVDERRSPTCRVANLSTRRASGDPEWINDELENRDATRSLAGRPISQSRSV